VGWRRMMEEVNLIKKHCKHIWKCQNEPLLVQLIYTNKMSRKRKSNFQFLFCSGTLLIFQYVFLWLLLKLSILAVAISPFGAIISQIPVNLTYLLLNFVCLCIRVYFIIKLCAVPGDTFWIWLRKTGESWCDRGYRWGPLGSGLTLG
jgi:hypothetical protein